MLYIVQFTQQNGEIESLYVKDTETGITAKDLLEVPGVLDNLKAKYSDIKIQLKKLDGAVNTYRTAGYGLSVEGDVQAAADNATLAQMMSLPATAAKSMMSTLADIQKDYVECAMEAMALYEGINESFKLCLPRECLSELDPELAEKLLTTKKSYALKDTQNQEIFQVSCTEEYGVQLPPLEVVHDDGENAISAVDLLRVVMPLRKQEGGSMYSYRTTYHTPYYRVDARLRGLVPSHLSWLNGYSVNDLLDIQQNEQRMANNLYTYICSDNARYVVQMVSGVFFDTQLGTLINRLCSKRSSEVVYELCDDIRRLSTEEASCELPMNEIDELLNAGWYSKDVAAMVEKHLVLKDGYLEKLLQDRPIDRRIVDCGSIPFSLKLTDAQEREFTEVLIQNGFLSMPMRNFLVGLCKRAYRVNWGHTGAVLAIPGFSDKTLLPDYDTQFAEYLRDRTQNIPVDPQKYPALFVKQQVEDDEEEDGDEIFVGFEYYVTDESVQRMIDGSLPEDFFYAKASPAQSTEASIVEYWRTVNGENNLDNLLFHAYLNTGDVQVFIESFIKLMRWGERKPKLLVLQKHPEIRWVLDLNTGVMMDNTTIVDENDLVKVNGCDYSLVEFLTTSSNAAVDSNQVVGFVLQKDYGKVQKYYLASWLDIGEMCASGNVNIGDLVVVKPLGDTLPRTEIESYAKKEYHFYVSDNNIEEGLKLQVQPRELSAMALLTTPSITTSTGYLRSLKNNHIITTKDRQYDILRRYLSVFDGFQAKCASEGWTIKDTVQLKEMALAFLNFYHGVSEKVEANQAAATNTLKTLDFGGGVSTTPSVQWDTTELKGKFYLITDKEMKASIRPIEFSDPQLQAVANRQLNRIVMLLLQTDKKFIFCRKDIGESEVKVIVGKDKDGNPRKSIGAAKYMTYAATIEALRAGVTTPKIQGLPVVLHESLKDVL